MVKSEPKKTMRPKAGAQAVKNEGLPFTRKNYYIFFAGLAAIILGYITLGQGSITLAPILLVLGYCVIIPVAILYRGGNKTPSQPGATDS